MKFNNIVDFFGKGEKIIRLKNMLINYLNNINNKNEYKSFNENMKTFLIKKFNFIKEIKYNLCEYDNKDLVTTTIIQINKEKISSNETQRFQIFVDYIMNSVSKNQKNLLITQVK